MCVSECVRDNFAPCYWLTQIILCPVIGRRSSLSKYNPHVQGSREASVNEESPASSQEPLYKCTLKAEQCLSLVDTLFSVYNRSVQGCQRICPMKILLKMVKQVKIIKLLKKMNLIITLKLVGLRS